MSSDGDCDDNCEVEYFDRHYRLYTLRDSDGCVRYVGLTQNEPEVRISGHKSSKGPVGKWMRAEIAAGRKILFIVEEEFFVNGYEDSKAYAAEKEYIRGYSQLVGDKLLNRMSVPKPSIVEVRYASEHAE